MRAAAVAVVLAATAALTGCSSALDVGYPEAAVNPGLLASVAPRRVAVGPVTDRRSDQTRIGARPENGKPIETARPVADIVRDALVVELTRNGHVVVPEGGDVRVAADVDDFWLDTAGSDGSTQYVGRVALAVAIRDEQGGSTVLVRRYAGIRRRYADPDAKEAWREVMDTALARTVHDLATDPELVRALGTVSR
jgi:hypothetical protein